MTTMVAPPCSITAELIEPASKTCCAASWTLRASSSDVRPLFAIELFSMQGNLYANAHFRGFAGKLLQVLRAGELAEVAFLIKYCLAGPPRQARGV